MTQTRASFVVLTHERKHELLRTLAHLDPGVATIVVDNASTDGSADALAQAFPRVRVIRLARNVGAAARNEGARAATTPYVAFCDDDTWWDAASVARAAAMLDRHPALAVVNARVLVGDEAREDPTCSQMAATPFAHAPDLPGFEIFGFLAGACMVRRSAFLDAGGYHPRFFLGAEEDLLAIDLMCAGWRMAYVPDVVVRHHPSRARDASMRERLVRRNSLWCAWLRRPRRSALARTRETLARAIRDGALVWTAASTLRAVPWLARDRRVVSPAVEAKIRLRERCARPPTARPPT